MPKKPIAVRELFPQLQDISDAQLRKAVIAVWEELWSMAPWDDFENMPTSPEIPYPARPHAQCVVTMALAVADAFESHHGVRVNRDVLIAAAILQDASKVIEYRPDGEGQAVLSDIGRTYQHAFWVAHLALQHGVPDDVVHILLTHSPQAPKFPNSLEGKILYYVDQLDVIAIYKDRWRKDLYITK